jgi:diamine N-acetyltransferase
MILSGDHILLRALEPEDLEFLYQIENNPEFWEVSHTQTPFSKYILKQYLENSYQDIYESKQLRLMIVDKINGQSMGMIDLFDFNPQHKRAGIGIVVDQIYQEKGIAFDALKTLIYYCFSSLQLHQLYANISSDNKKSIRLFEKSGFQLVGEKKDWLMINQQFKNELLFQLIHE